jgi:CHASE2 domain-containing sensor protein
MRRDPRHGFWPEFLRGAVLVGISVILTALLHQTLFVRELEWANLDSMFAWRGEKTFAQVDIVDINEDDYRNSNLFNSQSPLDRTLVMKLIRGIADAGARVIAVDILTPDWPSDTERQLDVSTPIVWVRGVEEKDDGQTILQPVLGGDGRLVCQGPARIREIFGVAREYDRKIHVSGDGIVRSFTDVIAQINAAGSKAPCRKTDEADDTRHAIEPIEYLGKSNVFRHISASTILTAMNHTEWGRRRLMDGKVVLLGGTFSESRDVYRTPVQTNMHGVEILANIVAAGMSGGWIDEAGRLLFLTIDVLVGLTLVTAGHFLRGFWALGVMIAVILIVLAGGLVLFQLFRFFLSFVPVLIGVMIHFLLERANSHRHIVAENRRLICDNERLARRVQALEANGERSGPELGSNINEQSAH